MHKRPEFIPIGQFARKTGTSLSYVRKLCREGKIDHGRVGQENWDALGRDRRPYVIAEYEIDNVLEFYPRGGADTPPTKKTDSNRKLVSTESPNHRAAALSAGAV